MAHVTVFHLLMLICCSQPFILLQNVSIPTDTFAFATGFYENKIMIVNGYNYVQSAYSISINNLSSNTWLEYNTLNMPFSSNRIYFYGQTYTQIDSKIYGVPQFWTNSGDLNMGPNLFIFDLINGVYQSLATYSYQLPQEAYGPCIVSVSNNLYIIGGYDDSRTYYPNTATPKLQIYDIITDEWSLADEMNIGRYFAGCSTDIDKKYIFIFGGFNGSYSLNSIEQYDISNNQWILLDTKLNVERSKPQCILANFDGYIYCIGGIIDTIKLNGDIPLKSTEIFDPINKKLVYFNDMSLLFTTNRYRINYGLIQTDNDRLLLIGGKNGVYSSSINSLEEILLTSSPTVSPTLMTKYPSINPTVNPTTNEPTTYYPTKNPVFYTTKRNQNTIISTMNQLSGNKAESESSNNVVIIIVVVIVIIIFLFGACFIVLIKYKWNSSNNKPINNQQIISHNNQQMVQHQNVNQAQIVMVQMPDGTMMNAQIMGQPLNQPIVQHIEPQINAPIASQQQQYEPEGVANNPQHASTNHHIYQ